MQRKIACTTPYNSLSKPNVEERYSYTLVVVDYKTSDLSAFSSISNQETTAYAGI